MTGASAWAMTLRAHAHPKIPPKRTHAAERSRTANTNGRDLRPGRHGVRGGRSARAAKCATIAAADDLVLEPLEEQLPAAPRTERLVRLAPRGSLAARLFIRGTELLDRRLPAGGRHKDLAQSVAAEIAVKLSACSHRGTS